MAWFGIALLALVLALVTCTGWPTYAVLIGVCSFGALVGVAGGGFDAALLGTLPGRVIGLLEHDLLQALALYALVGALLHRMSIASDLHAGLRKAIARFAPRSASALAGLSLGVLLAPMNGSVGASLAMLAKTAGQHADEASRPAQNAARIAIAGTLGVVVPPSLVLLLGDAMLRAHTEGLNIARQANLPLATANLRIVNTQDLMQAVLLPAAALLLGWLVLTAFIGTRQTTATARHAQPEPWLPRERWTLAVVPLVIAGLLTLVTLGRVRAVEAAAAAGVMLLLWGVVSRQLTRKLLWQALDDAMALTGALFALLVAATTFSLVMRTLGSDRLVNELMLSLEGHTLAATLAALGLLLAGAFVLDAFELIFLVVPIVMPPLLAHVGDAAWVAVLALLVLQAGFLLPPFGYAIVLARGQQQARPPLRAVASAVAPYLAWLAIVVALVIAFPQTTVWLRTAPPDLAPERALDNDAVERLMREMSPRREEPASAP